MKHFPKRSSGISIEGIKDLLVMYIGESERAVSGYQFLMICNAEAFRIY
jgi:hypothetical protein